MKFHYEKMTGGEVCVCACVLGICDVYTHAHRSVGQPEPRWVELLRCLVAEGVRRLDQVAQRGKLCLPGRLQFWRLEAGQVAEILGLTLELQRATPTFQVVAGSVG